MSANYAQCDDCGLGHPADGIRLCIECLAAEADREASGAGVYIRNIAFVMRDGRPRSRNHIFCEIGLRRDRALNVIKDLESAGYLYRTTQTAGGHPLLALNPDYVLSFGSPVERLFWEAHRDLLLKPLAGLTPQVQHGHYRIDFAVEEARFGIEIDGLAWHNQDSFIRDRNRQRSLEKDGWRITRFAAKEVMEDAAACVREAADQAVALVSA